MFLQKAQWELCRIIMGGVLLLWGCGAVWADEPPGSAPAQTPTEPDTGKPKLSPIEITLGLRKTPIPEHKEYQADAEYGKIMRYDYLPYWLEKEKGKLQPSAEEEDPTVRKMDRAMVLAGKGFQIPNLEQFVADPGVEINEYHHIDFDAPQPPLKERRDRLDPEFRGAVYRKELIFHPQVSAFHNVEPRKLEEDVRPDERLPLDPEPAEDTRLLLWSSGKTRLTLSPGKKQWDLLHGDEYRTRLDYTRTRRGLPPQGDDASLTQ